MGFIFAECTEGPPNILCVGSGPTHVSLPVNAAFRRGSEEGRDCL